MSINLQLDDATSDAVFDAFAARLTGLVGATGPEGPPGPTGATGATGATGPSATTVTSNARAEWHNLTLERSVLREWTDRL